MNEYKWIEDINVYLYIVESINEHFNLLKRTLIHEEIEKEFYYLCVELLRIFQFKKISDGVIKEDGICLLSASIDFLIKDLNNILFQNKEVFFKIKRIRNKYEHEPHNISSAFSTGSGAYSGIGFYYKDDLISINTMELTYIIYDLNILMDKIQNYIYDVEKNHQEEFDMFVNEYIKIIRKRKNIDYNKTYIRIPKGEMNFKLKDLINENRRMES